MTTDYIPERHSSHTLTAFVMGAALGAIAALLFAPASGAETRSRIKKLSEDAAREAKRRFEQGRTKFAQAVEGGEEALESELGGGTSPRDSSSYAQQQEEKYDH